MCYKKPLKGKGGANLETVFDYVFFGHNVHVNCYWHFQIFNIVLLSYHLLITKFSTNSTAQYHEQTTF